MKVPQSQVAPSGKAAASAGDYYTGYTLAGEGRAFGQMVGTMTDVGAGIANRRDALDLLHTRSAMIDRRSKWLMEQRGTPLLDDNGIPKDFTVDDAVRDIDGLYDEFRGMVANRSPDMRASVEEWLGGQRDALLDDVVRGRALQRKQFYETEGLNRVGSMYRNGNVLEGEQYREAMKAGYPHLAAQIDETADENHFLGILEHMGSDAAKDFLKKTPGTLSVKKRLELAGLADRYDEYLADKTEATSTAARHKARLDALTAIDTGDANGFSAVYGTPDLDVGAAEDKNTVTRETLLAWQTNRYKAAETDYGTAGALLSEALQWSSQPDQYAMRMKLAQARYGDGALSQEDYERIRSVLDKKYKPHETVSLKSGVEALEAKRRQPTFIPGPMGTFTTRSAMTDQEKFQQTQELTAWFDGELARNVVPTPQQTYAYAKGISVTKPQPKNVEVYDLETQQRAYLRTATNPKTGEQMGWDGVAWQPIAKP